MAAELALIGDLTLVLAASVGVVVVLRRVGVPSIAGFIVAGLLAGPEVLGLVGDAGEVHLLAEVGVVLLLFGIGLELSLERLRRLWKPVLLGGALQTLSTGALAAGVAAWLGLPWNSSVFLGFLAAISSTAIVLRGLSERGEVDAPHGRLSLGILVFQDLSVVPMMLALPILAGQSGGSPVEISLALGRTVAIIAGVLLAARLVVPRILHLVAATRQRDLFVLTVLVVGVGTAWAVGLAGVSLALGAFLGGLVVDARYRDQVLADVIPFREVFASLFFVSVGMLLDLDALMHGWWRVGLMVLGVILAKFALVVLTGLALRLPLRVATHAGAALAQVGEFSFVLLAAAAGTALVPAALEADVTAAAILTMLVTPLGIALGPHLAAGAGRLGALAGLLDVHTPEEEGADRLSGHVIVAGYGLAGEEIATALRDEGVEVLVVDIHTSNVRRAGRDGHHAVYGDVTSPEVLQHLGLTQASSLVLAISDFRANERAVRAARSVAPEVRVGVRALYAADVPLLRRAGADEVFSAEITTAIEMLVSLLHRLEVEPAEVERKVEQLRRKWERGDR